MNVTAKKVTGNNCILYNVVDDTEAGLYLPDGTVRADVYLPGQPKIIVMSTLDTYGGKAWKVVLEGNDKSFEDVYKTNGPLDIFDCQKVLVLAKQKVLQTLKG